MGSNNTEYWDKIAGYLKGELSEQDQRALFQWVESGPENEAVFEQVKKIWENSPDPGEGFEPDADRAWQRFQFRIESETALDNEPTAPESAKKIPLWPQIFRMAAVLAVFMGIGYFVHTTFFEDQMIVLTTAAGEKISHTLPDSSRVWLNANSQLRYAEDFNATHRMVYLKGEAFFEVQKAEGQRFTVLTEAAKTEVIGTSFHVSAYPDEPVSVQVVSGKVAFSPRNEDNSIFLEPGMEGVLEEDNVPEKSAIEDLNFRAWQNNELVFSNTSLQQLAKTLEVYFNVHIEIDNPNLNNCRFTATFDQPDITEILKVLSIAGNLTYDQQGNQYTLYGEGCQ